MVSVGAAFSWAGGKGARASNSAMKRGRDIALLYAILRGTQSQIMDSGRWLQ